MKPVESHLRDLSLEEMLQRAKRPFLKELKLVNFSLTDVPSSVWMATRLHELDLSKNRLRTLPRELTQLENLSALYLNENEIEELDPEIFDGLNNLEILEVAQNMIRDIPVRLCLHHPFIQHLDFSNNKLDKIPGELTMLPELTYLNLSNNYIQVIPKTIKNLQNLEDFKIANNLLTTLPIQLASLPHLRIVDASENRLTSVPEKLLSISQHARKVARRKSNRRRTFLSIGASLQLLLDGNPLHEFTTSSMAKREEMKKQHAALSAIAKGSSAGDSLATSGEKKAKVYTIGLLSESGAVKPAAAGSSGSLGLLGYSRSTKCTAIQTLRGYFTEGIDEDDVPEADEEEDKENDDPNTDDSEAEEWEEERRGEEELTYLGIKEHLAFLDYNNYFINTVHTNVIGTDRIQGPVCISIEKTPQPGTCWYRALVRTTKGDHRFAIPASFIKLGKHQTYASSQQLLKALKQLIPLKLSDLWVIRHPSCHQKLKQLESKLYFNPLRFGILYARDGQTENEIYANNQTSPAFEEFLELMGTKVDIDTFDKPKAYKAGLNKDDCKHSWYTEYRGFPIMFHVAPYLNASPSDPQQLGRKRHIGNDVVTIVFYEGNSPLKLDFGGFIHAYAVVQPNRDKHATNYRISMNYKQEVVPPTPELPENGVLSKSAYFREFLLTKIINAEFCSHGSEKLRLLTTSFRKEHILHFQDMYPKERERSRAGKEAVSSPMAQEKGGKASGSGNHLLGLNDDASANYYLDPKTLSRFVKKIQEEKEAGSAESSPAPNEKRKWYRSGMLI